TRSLTKYMQLGLVCLTITSPLFNMPSLLNTLKTLNRHPDLYVPGAPNYDFNASLPQFNAVNSYRVRETSSAAYFQAGFAGDNWAGNAGVRVVHTKTTASTAVNEIQSVTIANTSNPTDPAFVQYSDATPTTSPGSYTLPLPSLNFTYHFRPDLQLRFGA